MVESTLILKKGIPPDTFYVSVKTDLFKDGHVYTWSLRQVYDVSGKSRRSFHSFKVVKKP
jgi:hypothetical protein